MDKDTLGKKNAVPDLAQIATLIPDSVVFATDTEGRYTLFEGSGFRRLGIIPEKWVGKSIFEFLKDSPKQLAIVKRVFQGESYTDRSQFRSRFFDDYFSPIYDENGTLLGIYGIQIDVTERVLAENHLNNNSELLNNLFNSIPDNIYVLDLDFNVVRINQAVQTMFPGIPLTGAPCYSTVHGLEKPCDFCPVVKTYNSGNPETVEYFETKRNRYYELSSFPVRDQKTGQIIGATETAKDITDRKRMEESLLRNKTMLDELLVGLDEVVYLIDTNYTILQANKAMGDAYPHLMPLVGRKCYDTTIYGRICPDCAAEYSFREGKVTTRRFYEKNGEDEPGMWFELTSFPIFGDKDNNNVVTQVLGIMRNVTPRVELESQLDEYRIQIQTMAETQMQELRLSEARIRSILETSGVAISFADYRGRFTYINGMFKEMFGFTEEETYGKHLTSLLDDVPEMKEKENQKIEDALSGQSDHYRSTCKLVTKDGRQLWGDINISVIHGTQPEDTQLISVIIDTTSQQQLVEYLNRAKSSAEEASLAKSQFLATMSHEIRTPLNGVIGVSNLLMETQLQPKQSEYAKLIKASGESLLFLINDILDFSKIEAGKFDLEHSEFNLYEMLESVIGIFASKAAEKNLDLIATFDDMVPGLVLGDMGRLRQILINLVGNAMKFTEKGGVHLHTSVIELLDNQVCLKFTVTDTGIGIAENRRNRLFKSFSQVDASSARVYGGTGLGLAISKKLIDLMGGDIHVESVPEKGSKFWFTAKLGCSAVALNCLQSEVIPCVAEKEVCNLDVSSRCCSRSGRDVAYLQHVEELRGLKTLIIGVGAVKIPALLEQTRFWGLEARAVANYEAALPLFDKAVEDDAPFRLIIIDFSTDNTSGESALRSIQGREELQDTVCIALTPLSDDLRKHSWKNPEKIRFVSKPICCSSLLYAIVRSFYSDSMPQISHDTGTMTANTANAAATQSQTRTIRVLVAEDNRINQIVISEILKNAEMASTIVENGVEVLKQLNDAEFDIILMDCQMPIMDGYEATRKIRESEEGRHHSERLPIIALTANATSEDESKCIAAGMDAYCSKPVDPQKLIEKINNWCFQSTKENEAFLEPKN